jgi:hypothetical protein
LPGKGSHAAAGAAISFSVLTSGTITPSGTTVTTASVTPGANKLILAIIATRWTSIPPDDVIAVTGNGLTWVRVQEEQYADSRTIGIYRSLGASPSSGTIVFTESSGDAYSGNACVTILEVSNVDTTGTNGSGAVGTAATAIQAGGTSLGLTITGTPGVGDVSFGAIGTMDNTTGLTSDALWATINEAGPSDETLLRSDWDDGQDLSPTWTWSASRPAAAIGFIVNAP